MKFSNYYKTVIEANGVPNLNLEQHKRLFNIIHIEGQLKRIKDELKHFGYNAVSVSDKERLESKKDKLFNNLTHPASVFSDMLEKSNII